MWNVNFAPQILKLFLWQLTLTEEQFMVEDRQPGAPVAELCRLAKATAQRLLNHYVRVQGLTISQVCVLFLSFPYSFLHCYMKERDTVLNCIDLLRVQPKDCSATASKYRALHSHRCLFLSCLSPISLVFVKWTYRGT